MDDRLIEASQGGDIDVLYELIGADDEVLRGIDKIMFVDTPLHIAASVGQTCFAMEMMNLMPSFARKLNKSGLSPMHLATEKGNTELVLSFLEVDCDLVRVKGKGGLTPLHFAVKYGHVDLLAKFLVVCPKSIEDVTVNGETALHIALYNNMLEAHEVLVGWLQRICHKDAFKWKANIPNRKDLQGKTAWDIALPSDKQPELESLNEIANISEGRPTTSISVQNPPTSSSDESLKTLRKYLTSKRSFDEKFAVFITRHKMTISDNARSALLVVLGLLVPATFQAIFNPPGSVRQEQDDNNNNNSNATTVINASGKQLQLPGTVVMDSQTFLIYSLYNTGTFNAAVCLTGLLLPDGLFGSTVMILLFFLQTCYFTSVVFISPNDVNLRTVVYLFSLFMVAAVSFIREIHRRGKAKLRQHCCTSD